MSSQQQTKKKSGAVITIIGRQESGKTPIIMWLLKKFAFKTNVIYDPNFEYSAEYTLFHYLETFKKVFLTLVKAFIVIEEATGFISLHRSAELQDLCVRIAHKNNICVFVFHSMVDAPVSILNKSRFIIILKTMDDAQAVKRERNRYFEAYMAAQTGDEPVWVDNYKLAA